MKRSAAAALVGLALVVATIGGTTLGLFTSTAGQFDSTGDVNFSETGTIELSFQHPTSPGTDPAFDQNGDTGNYFMPGDFDEWINTITNTGNQPGTVSVEAILVDSTPGTGGGELPDAAEIWMTTYETGGPEGYCGSNINGGEWKGSGVTSGDGVRALFIGDGFTGNGFRNAVTVADALAGGPWTLTADAGTYVLEPGQSLCVGSKLKLPEETGNEFQGASMTLDFEFTLVQLP